jgi:hypothetical protein
MLAVAPLSSSPVKCFLPSWLSLVGLAREQAECPDMSSLRESPSLDVVYYYFSEHLIYSDMFASVSSHSSMYVFAEEFLAACTTSAILVGRPPGG